MEIQDNKLIGATFKQTPNSTGNLKSYKYIIIHDDYGASVEGTTSWILNPQSKVSYHILIGKGGEIVQYTGFNKRAWHCGTSTWEGLSDLNWHTIGVCMQNKGGEAYTEKQISTAIDVCKAISIKYNIKQALGHKQIAPNRKSDPNNNFPWDRFNNSVFGSNDNLVETKITTSNLNLRDGAGTNHKVLRVLNKGTKVSILGEKSGWCEVLVCDQNVRGWVSSNYLK